MGLSTDIKYWLRSGSLGFARDRAADRAQGAYKHLNWAGRQIFYRPGTSDVEMIYRILLKPVHKREYTRPPLCEAKVIWDIGANIGIAAIWLEESFPGARVFSFEPIPENYELLRLNTSQFAGIQTFPFALGSQDATLDIFSSDNPVNEGGYSFHSHGINPERKQSVPIRSVQAVYEELGRPEIDILKIDTEGSEHDILTAFSPEVLKRVKWILGELHGNKDFELLAYLSQWFDVQVKKDLRNRLMYFQAARKILN